MKKQIVIKLFLILTMAMTLSACGKETDNEESATVGSIIDIEDIREEIPTEDVEEEMDVLETEVSTETEEVNTQSEKESVSETSMNEQQNQQQNQQSAEIVEESSEEQQAVEQPTEQPVEQPTEQPVEQQVQEPIVEQPVPTATLNGHIDSIGNGEFVIRKSNVISSGVIVSSGEDAEKVAVIYKDSTEFVLCSTSDGGITADYSPASASNLSDERMVEIQGCYEGNYFVAKKVTIYNFQ